jgi:Polyketide cyclase / dehydrase and lipid transport
MKRRESSEPGREPMRALTVDEQLVDTANARGVAEREMAVSAEQLFGTLVDGQSWSKWVPVIREVTWTSPEPFAKGTTRTLQLVGGISVDEVFWAWEDNRRMAFSVTAANVGWVNAFSERYEITPISSERCIVRWTLAPSYAGWVRRIEPVLKRGLPIAQKRLLKTLERVARERSSRR